ncbi:MAG: Ltp family lipoprotein, partial [Staphylococcus sp.]|nr:Ltp family lipoprotein [Staphylococcus sp.]
KKANDYVEQQNMSKDAVYNQLTSDVGEKFTEEEAQYAVDHLDK